MEFYWNYIIKNKEWLFSGGGIFAITISYYLVRRLFNPDIKKTESSFKNSIPPQDGRNSPDPWETIRPPASRYRLVTGKANSVSAAVQFHNYEYALNGHAHPLNLNGVKVRCEIEFSCQITNPMDAISALGEYALNILPPRFLMQARPILEKYTFTKLRKEREKAASQILNLMKPQFNEAGFALLSVTISAVDKV